MVTPSPPTLDFQHCGQGLLKNPAPQCGGTIPIAEVLLEVLIYLKIFIFMHPLKDIGMGISTQTVSLTVYISPHNNSCGGCINSHTLRHVEINEPIPLRVTLPQRVAHYGQSLKESHTTACKIKQTSPSKSHTLQHMEINDPVPQRVAH